MQASLLDLAVIQPKTLQTCWKAHAHMHVYRDIDAEPLSSTKFLGIFPTNGWQPQQQPASFFKKNSFFFNVESVQAFAKFKRPDGTRSNHRELEFSNFSGPRPQKVCHTYCAPFHNRRTSIQYHPLQGLTVRKSLT